MVDNYHPSLSVSHQCRMLSMLRSAYCYKPKGENEFNLRLMRLIDEQFLETQFSGSRRMRYHLILSWLSRWSPQSSTPDAQEGLSAICQKPRATVPHPEHRVYP